MIGNLFWALVLACVAFAVYVRFAPYDAATWHITPQTQGVGDKAGLNTFHATRQLNGSPSEVLNALEAVILRDARTKRVSGSPEAQLVTYETRSLLFGYPDYTTVGVVDGADGAKLISIHGRARFGKSDINQNKQSEVQLCH